MAKILVVGGGLGGLASAALLARDGHDVTLRERSSRLGGRARSHRAGRAMWNQGPHALYLGGAAQDVLQEMGIWPAGGKPPTRDARVRLDGRLVSTSPGAMLCSPTWSGHRIAMLRAMASLQRVDADALAGTSFTQWLHRYASDPLVRRFLDALRRVATYSADPDLDAAVAVRMLQRALRPGVRYVHGGWQRMVDDLATAAEAAGAVLETSTPVSALHGPPWSVDDEVFDAAVLAVPPKAAAHLLGDAAPAAIREASHWPALEAHCRTLVLAGRRGPGFVGDLDGRGYYAVHSRTAHLAPGDDVVQAAWYLHGADDAERDLEAFLDAVRPDWWSDVVHDEILPRMTVMQAIPPHGDVRLRPGADQGDGLFVVGDWVGQEWLVDAVFESADQVRRRLQAPMEVRTRA